MKYLVATLSALTLILCGLFLYSNSHKIIIRVGTDCSCRSCEKVICLELEEYVSRSLPAEWYPNWEKHSLMAGAVAVRTYALYHKIHPINAEYDICDTECCQVLGSKSYNSTNQAVNETVGVILVDYTGKIAKPLYSSEANATGGCGDGFIRSTSGGQCLNDEVCLGAVPNGHGLGMCQWGSQRWALKDRSWVWILAHYYSSLRLQKVSNLDKLQ